MKNAGFVYIMSNKSNTTFYIGATGDLEQRVLQHKAGVGSQFTSKYSLNQLVYVETAKDVASAFEREKQLKNWRREWKLKFIKSRNPNLVDLAEGWFSDLQIKDYRLNATAEFQQDPEMNSG